MVHAAVCSCAVVVADDRLCRLCHGAAYHIHQREQITGNAVCRHAVAADILHKSHVARQHHYRHRQFAHQSGGSHSGHVAHIAQGQPQACPGVFQAIQMQRPCAEQHIIHHHQCSDKPADVCGQGRAHHAPMAGENKDIVQYPVHDGRDDVRQHGIAWRPVQTDDKQPQSLNHQQQACRQKPQVILLG